MERLQDYSSNILLHIQIGINFVFRNAPDLHFEVQAGVYFQPKNKNNREDLPATCYNRWNTDKQMVSAQEQV